MPAYLQEITAIHEYTSPQFPSCQIDDLAAIPESKQSLPEPEFGDEPEEFDIVEDHTVSVLMPEIMFDKLPN